MRLAVVTPYFREPHEKLWRCHRSVKNQTCIADHIMVADGQPNAAVDAWDVEHIKLPSGTADSGDTPRLIGLLMAYALGYDAFMLLDGDNWYEPHHVEALLETQRATGASIVTCPRTLRRRDASVLLAVCIESDGRHFNDFNCYLFMRDALAALRPLVFHDRQANYFTDRFLWNHLCRTNLPIARSMHPTVNYETTIMAHYNYAKEAPPPQAKSVVTFADTGETRALTAEQMQELQTNPKFRLIPRAYKIHESDAS